MILCSINTMRKTNLQIRIPEDLDVEITALSPRSKSDFVRQAIQEKIEKERSQRLEDQWIKALGIKALAKKSDQRAEDNALEEAQAWGSK